MLHMLSILKVPCMEGPRLSIVRAADKDNTRGTRPLRDIRCCLQAGAETFGALCLEPYSRGRILAGYSRVPSGEVEALAAGGIATIDLGSKKVLSKVCCTWALHALQLLAGVLYLHHAHLDGLLPDPLDPWTGTSILVWAGQ